jgi:uncharacterized protein (DUF362 family)
LARAARRYNLDMRKTPAALAACDSYDPAAVRQALAALLAPLGGLPSFIRPGARVLVKPNWIVARPPEAAATTHPVLIAEICRAVLDCGARPVVGDGIPVGAVRRTARVTGTLDALRPLGVDVLDLNRKLRVPCVLAKGLPPLVLDPRALEMDAIINAPKLKTHCQCVMSLGIKNMFGCAPGRVKALWHFRAGATVPYDEFARRGLALGGDRFAVMLVETAARLRPALTILDAVVAMEGRGPIGGAPRQMGFLAASPDPVAIDAVGAHIVGLPPERLPALAAAAAMGVGAHRMEDIDLLGDGVRRFMAADFRHAPLMPVRFSLSHIMRGYARQMWMKVTGGAAKGSAVRGREG